jgi:hypothetical protein
LTTIFQELLNKLGKADRTVFSTYRELRNLSTFRICDSIHSQWMSAKEPGVRKMLVGRNALIKKGGRKTNR